MNRKHEGKDKEESDLEFSERLLCDENLDDGKKERERFDFEILFIRRC